MGMWYHGALWSNCWLEILLNTSCVLIPLQAFPLPSGNLDSSHLYEGEDKVMLTKTHLQE